jgi:two-component system sensor histidine kinase HydH
MERNGKFAGFCNIEIHYHRFLSAPDHHRFYWFIGARIHLLMRYPGWDEYKIARSGFFRKLQMVAPPESRPSLNDVEHSLEVTMMVRGRAGGGLHDHCPGPEFFGPGACLSDCRGSRHARRLRGVGVQFARANDSNAMSLPVGLIHYYLLSRSMLPAAPIPTARFKLRVQDILLALMFGALIYLTHTESQMWLLTGLAVLQLIEGHVALLDTTGGRFTSVVLQLILGFLLLGITGAIESPYFLVLMLPIVSAASFLGLSSTLLSTLAAIGAYLSFLFYEGWSEFRTDPEAVHLLTIRCLLPAVAAVLINSLGEAIRTQSSRYKSTAEQLAEANRNLVAAEAAMRRSDRLAALGQLSAGLAHELRNPLGSIKGSADLLARSASRNDPGSVMLAKELAEIISSEVDRTNSLVTRFLDFARPLEPKRELTDVTQVIDRAIKRSKAEVIRDYAASLPPIPIDPELMEQVFLNLLSNAAEASSPGGPVTARTREVNDQAEVSVIDFGCGIAADHLDTIFNPFVTTKQTGVGLGLAIVSKIVDGHGGKMSVESEPGKGSTFRVFLPIKS